MKWEAQKAVSVVVGCSGSGKSTFALRAMIAWDGACRFVFDPDQEFSARLGIHNVKTEAEALAAIPTGWVLWDMSELTQDNDVAANVFAEWVYHVSGQFDGRKLVVIDELQEYMSAQRRSPSINRLCERGRKREIEFLGIAQRPSDLHPAVLSQATEVICFEQGTVEADKRKMAALGFGDEAVGALRQFEWISRSKQGGEARGKIQFV